MGQKTSVIPRRELATRVQNYNYNAKNVGIPEYAFMHLYNRSASLRQLLPACSAAFMHVSEHILGNYLFCLNILNVLMTKCADMSRPAA